MEHNITINFLHEYENFVNNYINNEQKKYTDELFVEKTPSDKINCLICNGKYIRSLKCLHEKTNKHKIALQKLQDELKKKLI